ncbi:hypothetical protein WUBG_09299 [Wuchereria bancrofti]|uniref:Uncharacterized protein n=1 Tax=Wuchereria bancrofti TaxID=6293 RepID=J9ERT6_WUCBA|nr:hypothetical protein WUBG_09299 [Wuchereria bancrofti]
MGIYFLSYVTTYSNTCAPRFNIEIGSNDTKALQQNWSQCFYQKANENEISVSRIYQEKQSKGNSKLAKRLCKDVIKVRIPWKRVALLVHPTRKGKIRISAILEGVAVPSQRITEERNKVELK